MIPRQLQRQLFNWLYTGGAWIYDPLTILLFAGEWREWQRSVLPLLHGDHILDLGCGTGQLLPDLASRASLVVGLDRSTAMLHRARRRAEGSRARLVRGEARALPFRTGTFTTVVSTFPAEYILDRQVQAEIARVLTPGGRLVVVVSGTIEQWAWWQLPLRFALRLFYGSAHRPGRYAGIGLTGGTLPGEWRLEPGRRGHALVWVAERRG